MPEATVTYSTPAPGEFDQARTLLELAETYAIDSELMYTSAADDLKKIKGRAAELEERRQRITKPLLEAKRAVDDLFREPLEWLATAERTLKGAMARYHQALEDKRRAEQARLDALARAEREKLERRAARAAEEGHVEKAEAMAATAAVVSAPIAATRAPAVAGVSYRTKYDATVSSKAELLAFVATHPMFHYLVDVNATNLRRLAESQKDAFALPGCELKIEKVLASTR